MLNLLGISVPRAAANAAGFAERVRKEQQDSIRRGGGESSVAAKADNSRGEESPGALGGLTLEQARALALEAGFQEAGLVALPYEAEARDAERFREWVAKGRAGTMGYLERKAENGRLLRERAAVPFPWARSALVCFASYAFPEAPLSTKAGEPGRAWIARYAWSSRTNERGERRPSDYHKVLLKRIRLVEARLHEQLGEFESRAYVDTGPIVERALAVAAGLGWAAKNTCLIHPKLGSFGFLAVLLTSLEVSESASQQVSKSAREGMSDRASQRPGLQVPDRCGSCTRCIEACPTDALDVPYQMDATRCIAYLTIEHKGPIAEELAANMGRQVFGCDICQDVCPWNGKVRRGGPIVADAELEPRQELVNPALEWLAEMDEQEFEREFNGSPVRRTGFMGLRRNVAIAMGNSGTTRFSEQLEAWATVADDGLAMIDRLIRALNRYPTV
jgi:epoxyqueuosine reductase